MRRVPIVAPSSSATVVGVASAMAGSGCGNITTASVNSNTKRGLSTIGASQNCNSHHDNNIYGHQHPSSHVAVIIRRSTSSSIIDSSHKSNNSILTMVTKRNQSTTAAAADEHTVGDGDEEAYEDDYYDDDANDNDGDNHDNHLHHQNQLLGNGSNPLSTNTIVNAQFYAMLPIEASAVALERTYNVTMTLGISSDFDQFRQQQIRVAQEKLRYLLAKKAAVDEEERQQSQRPRLEGGGGGASAATTEGGGQNSEHSNAAASSSLMETEIRQLLAIIDYTSNDLTPMTAIPITQRLLSTRIVSRERWSNALFVGPTIPSASATSSNFSRAYLSSAAAGGNHHSTYNDDGDGSGNHYYGGGGEAMMMASGGGEIAIDEGSAQDLFHWDDDVAEGGGGGADNDTYSSTLGGVMEQRNKKAAAVDGSDASSVAYPSDGDDGDAALSRLFGGDADAANKSKMTNDDEEDTFPSSSSSPSSSSTALLLATLKSNKQEASKTLFAYQQRLFGRLVATSCQDSLAAAVSTGTSLSAAAYPSSSVSSKIDKGRSLQIPIATGLRGGALLSPASATYSQLQQLDDGAVDAAASTAAVSSSPSSSASALSPQQRQYMATAAVAGPSVLRYAPTRTLVPLHSHIDAKLDEVYSWGYGHETITERAAAAAATVSNTGTTAVETDEKKDEALLAADEKTSASVETTTSASMSSLIVYTTTPTPARTKATFLSSAVMTIDAIMQDPNVPKRGSSGAPNLINSYGTSTITTSSTKHVSSNGSGGGDPHDSAAIENTMSRLLAIPPPPPAASVGGDSVAALPASTAAAKALPTFAEGAALAALPAAVQAIATYANVINGVDGKAGSDEDGSNLRKETVNASESSSTSQQQQGASSAPSSLVDEVYRKWLWDYCPISDQHSAAPATQQSTDVSTTTEEGVKKEAMVAKAMMGGTSSSAAPSAVLPPQPSSLSPHGSRGGNDIVVNTLETLIPRITQNWQTGLNFLGFYEKCQNGHADSSSSRGGFGSNGGTSVQQSRAKLTEREELVKEEEIIRQIEQEEAEAIMPASSSSRKKTGAKMNFSPLRRLYRVVTGTNGKKYLVKRNNIKSVEGRWSLLEEPYAFVGSNTKSNNNSGRRSGGVGKSSSSYSSSSSRRFIRARMTRWDHRRLRLGTLTNRLVFGATAKADLGKMSAAAGEGGVHSTTPLFDGDDEQQQQNQKQQRHQNQKKDASSSSSVSSSAAASTITLSTPYRASAPMPPSLLSPAVVDGLEILSIAAAEQETEQRGSGSRKIYKSVCAASGNETWWKLSEMSNPAAADLEDDGDDAFSSSAAALLPTVVAKKMTSAQLLAGSENIPTTLSLPSSDNPLTSLLASGSGSDDAATVAVSTSTTAHASGYDIVAAARQLLDGSSKTARQTTTPRSSADSSDKASRVVLSSYPASVLGSGSADDATIVSTTSVAELRSSSSNNDIGSNGTENPSYNVNGNGEIVLTAASLSLPSSSSSTSAATVTTTTTEIKRIVAENIVPKVMAMCVAEGQYDTATQLFDTFLQRADAVPPLAALSLAVAVGGKRRSWFMTPQLLDILSTRVDLDQIVEADYSSSDGSSISSVSLSPDVIEDRKRGFVAQYLAVILNTYVEAGHWEEGLSFVRTVGLRQLSYSSEALGASSPAMVPFMKLLLLIPPSILTAVSADGKDIFGRVIGGGDKNDSSSTSVLSDPLVNVPQYQIVLKAIGDAARRTVAIRSEQQQQQQQQQKTTTTSATTSSRGGGGSQAAMSSDKKKKGMGGAAADQYRDEDYDDFFLMYDDGSSTTAAGKNRNKKNSSSAAAAPPPSAPAGLVVSAFGEEVGCLVAAFKMLYTHGAESANHARPPRYEATIQAMAAAVPTPTTTKTTTTHSSGGGSNGKHHAVKSSASISSSSASSSIYDTPFAGCTVVSGSSAPLLLRQNMSPSLAHPIGLLMATNGGGMSKMSTNSSDRSRTSSSASASSSVAAAAAAAAAPPPVKSIQARIDALLLALDACARHGLYRRAIALVDAHHALLQPRLDVKKFVVDIALPSHADKSDGDDDSKNKTSFIRDFVQNYRPTAASSASVPSSEEDTSALSLSNAVTAFVLESILKADRYELPLAALPELFLTVIRLLGLSFDIPLTTTNGSSPPAMTLEEMFDVAAMKRREKGDGEDSTTAVTSTTITPAALSAGIVRSAVPIMSRRQHAVLLGMTTTTTATTSSKVDTTSSENEKEDASTPTSTTTATLAIGMVGNNEHYLSTVLNRREQLHNFFLNFAAEHGFGHLAIEHGCRLVSTVDAIFHPNITVYSPLETASVAAANMLSSSSSSSVDHRSSSSSSTANNNHQWRNYLPTARRLFMEETTAICRQLHSQNTAANTNGENSSSSATSSDSPSLLSYEDIKAFYAARKAYAARLEVKLMAFKQRLQTAENLFTEATMPFMVYNEQKGGEGTTTAASTNEARGGSSHSNEKSAAPLTPIVRPWQSFIVSATTTTTTNASTSTVNRHNNSKASSSSSSTTTSTIPFVRVGARNGSATYVPMWGPSYDSPTTNVVPIAGCGQISTSALAVTNTLRTRRVEAPPMDEEAKQIYLDNYQKWIRNQSMFTSSSSASSLVGGRAMAPLLPVPEGGATAGNHHDAFDHTTETLLVPTRRSDTSQTTALCEVVAESATLGAICPTPRRMILSEYADDDNGISSRRGGGGRDSHDGNNNRMNMKKRVITVHSSPSSIQMRLAEGSLPLRLRGAVGIDQFLPPKKLFHESFASYQLRVAKRLKRLAVVMRKRKIGGASDESNESSSSPSTSLVGGANPPLMLATAVHIEPTFSAPIEVELVRMIETRQLRSEAQHMYSMLKRGLRRLQQQNKQRHSNGSNSSSSSLSLAGIDPALLMITKDLGEKEAIARLVRALALKRLVVTTINMMSQSNSNNSNGQNSNNLNRISDPTPFGGYINVVLGGGGGGGGGSSSSSPTAKAVRVIPPPRPMAQLLPPFEKLALFEVQHRGCVEGYTTNGAQSSDTSSVKSKTIRGPSSSAADANSSSSGVVEVIAPQLGNIQWGLPFHKLSARPISSDASAAADSPFADISFSAGASASTRKEDGGKEDNGPLTTNIADCVILRKLPNVSTASTVRYYNLASQEVQYPQLSRVGMGKRSNIFSSAEDDDGNRNGALPQHNLHDSFVPSSSVSDGPVVTLDDANHGSSSPATISVQGMAVSYRPLVVLPTHAKGLLPVVPLHYGRTFGSNSYLTIRAQVYCLNGSSSGSSGDNNSIDSSHSSPSPSASQRGGFLRDCSSVVRMFNVAVSGDGNASAILTIEATIRLERGTLDGRNCLEHFEQSLIQCGWAVVNSPFLREGGNGDEESNHSLHESDASSCYHYVRSEGSARTNPSSNNSGRKSKKKDSAAADDYDLRLSNDDGSSSSSSNDSIIVTKVTFVCDVTASTRTVQLFEEVLPSSSSSPSKSTRQHYGKAITATKRVLSVASHHRHSAMVLHSETVSDQ